MQKWLLYSYCKTNIASEKYGTEDTTFNRASICWRPNQYTGGFGVYAVKKGRITLKSLEKLIKKYYKTKENTKIVREDKITKQTEIIYQSE